eukprot:TRINITY_DN7503_c0_g1_i4.p2 TRINITY_DN7503_c0_g1~~TRINITY_DN7503_c0_g1_i4.p2  ORF type:complete len:449 (-),score=68.00 TRINITY_DN7503_c0_g1_i4:72-1418(-)
MFVPEIAMGLLRSEALNRGVIPFFSNLLRSISSEKNPEILNRMYTSPSNQWLKEYERGLGMELYALSLSPDSAGKTYVDLLLEWYEKDILFLGFSREGIVHLAPNSSIREGDIGLFIAEDFNSLHDKTRFVEYARSERRHSIYMNSLRTTTDVEDRPYKLKKKVESSKLRNKIPFPPENLEGHVVICGDLSVEILQLVNAWPKIPIVLMSDLPESELNLSWATQSNLYYRYGDMTIRSDLEKAGVHNAFRVIVLPSPGVFDQSLCFVDAKAIVAYKLACQLIPNPDSVIIVLLSDSSANFLLQNLEDEVEFSELLKSGPLRNPYYAAGCVALHSTMNMFLIASVLTPMLWPALQELLQVERLNTKVLDKKMLNNYSTFGDLFAHFLKKTPLLLPVALHRTVIPQDSKSHISKKQRVTKYILTMPPLDLLLREGDSVLVVLSNDKITKT